MQKKQHRSVVARGLREVHIHSLARVWTVSLVGDETEARFLLSGQPEAVKSFDLRHACIEAPASQLGKNLRGGPMNRQTIHVVVY
jgi:hypothetical protein